MRLNQYVALACLTSRRSADKMIEEGRVMINDEKAPLGAKGLPFDKVCVDERPVTIPEDYAIYAYYKPRGVVCTAADPKVPVKDTLGYIIEYGLMLPERVTYAGRLDRDSEGLLLLTNDGRLIQDMMRGKNSHEKEYHVSVDLPVTDSFLKEMERGVYLKDLDVTTRYAKTFPDKDDTKAFNIILTQGLNRQIRRMCAEFGFSVKRLIRKRVLNIELGEMREGDIRKLTDEETKALYLNARGRQA